MTSPALARAILDLTGEDALAFFDAIAPIVHADSIDESVAWRQSRYDKPGPGGDAKAYINCPLDEAQYDGFIDALLAGDKTEFKDWEKDTPYFEGCLPIEVMAGRGRETLRFGPMKPVGLTDPRTGRRAHAVVQLRQDNALGTLFNMVGFQTKLKHGAQTEIFRTIPGLEKARFARLGGIHRNTFLNSPKLLDDRTAPEGRSAAALRRPDHRRRGLCRKRRHRPAGRAHGGGRAAGCCLSRRRRETTALGALLRHITGGAAADSIPAHEREFRPHAAAGADRRQAPEGPDAQAGNGTAGACRSGKLAGTERRRSIRPGSKSGRLL